MTQNTTSILIVVSSLVGVTVGAICLWQAYSRWRGATTGMMEEEEEEEEVDKWTSTIPPQPPEELSQGDLDMIFSNVDDIIVINSRFLKGLEKSDSEGQLHLLGNSFLEFKEEMENTSKVYCASYDQALALMEMYKKVPNLQKVIHDGITALVPQARASGLSFLLVIPVQPVTRYPPLLLKILENPPPDDQAYEALQRDTRATQEVNSNVNEYKRWRENATDYKVEPLTAREPWAQMKTLRPSQCKQGAGIGTRTLQPAADTQVKALVNKYGPSKLCQMTSNINGIGNLAVTLQRGQIVAPLQDRDIKGNTSCWMVDTGGIYTRNCAVSLLCLGRAHSHSSKAFLPNIQQIMSTMSHKD
ncbi:rho guanine nucleotide exchange factor 37-like [Monodelphis domestica]|uniref:rho guanine nucleotide exchange factor 37-like n=1 Tax=Monodelphis domestica TaxID=13616 RepID=UPI0024E1D8A5|nr:rho guanine nucleotide exchange factor 37-like [Monodelphis domestica]